MTEENNNEDAELEAIQKELDAKPKRKHPAWMYEAMAYAAENLDDWSIGCLVFHGDGARFMDELRKKPGLKQAIDIRRAQWRLARVMRMNKFVTDDTIPIEKRVKEMRKDMQTDQHWAPATRALKMQVEDTRTVLDFESLSQEEQDSIVAKNNEDETDESN